MKFSTFVTTLATLVPICGYAADQDLLDQLATLDYRKEGGAFKHQILAAMAEDGFKNGWEAGLLEVVTDTRAKVDGRQLAAELLKRCVTEASSEQLIPLLSEQVMSQFARDLLIGLQGETVDQGLVDAVVSTYGGQRLGIISTLAKRRAEVAVPALVELAKNERNMDTVAAALNAIGLIGGEDALQFFKNNLSWLEDKAPFSQAFTEAALLCLNGEAELSSKGVKRVATAILKSEMPLVQRTNAFVVLQKLNPSNASAVADLLKSDDLNDHIMARRAMSEMELDSTEISKLIKASEKWDVHAQEFLLNYLYEQKDSKALPLARNWFDAEGDARMAESCMEVMGLMGDHSDAVKLYALAKTKGPQQENAINAISEIGDRKVNDWISGQFAEAENKDQQTLLELMAARGMKDEILQLMDEVDNYHATTQKYIYRGVGNVANNDQVDTLMQRRLTVSSSSLKSEIERAVVEIGRRSTTNDVSERLIHDWEAANGDEKARLLRMISVVPQKPAREIIKGLVMQPKADPLAFRLLTSTRDEGYINLAVEFIEREDLSETEIKQMWNALFRLAKEQMSKKAWIGINTIAVCAEHAPSINELETIINTTVEKPNELYIGFLRNLKTEELEEKRLNALSELEKYFGV